MFRVHFIYFIFKHFKMVSYYHSLFILIIIIFFNKPISFFFRSGRKISHLFRIDRNTSDATTRVSSLPHLLFHPLIGNFCKKFKSFTYYNCNTNHTHHKCNKLQPMNETKF